MESTYIFFYEVFSTQKAQIDNIHDFKKIEYISGIAIEPKPQKINYVWFTHTFGEVEWQKITQMRIWSSENERLRWINDTKQPASLSNTIPHWTSEFNGWSLNQKKSVASVSTGQSFTNPQGWADAISNFEHYCA